MAHHKNVQEIPEAAWQLRDLIETHPQCDAALGEEYIRRNELRPYPLLTLSPTAYQAPLRLQALGAMDAETMPMEDRVLQSLLSSALPVQLLNPMSEVIYLGRGPGTLAACFGIPLDAKLGHQPIGNKTIDEVLEAGMPDVENSGIIPEMRRHIEAIQATTPDFVQIAPPDTQGPFNIAHMVVGDEAFLAPLLEPEKFDALMTMITDFYIAFYKRLRTWIGEKRYPVFVNARCRLRECSANLISADMYLEHVLRHDIRIAEFFGEVCVHPCSGRHVFLATLRNLPNIVFHEAMPYKNSIAPNISIEEAVAEIGERPIRLLISRSVSMATAKEIISGDFELIREHPAFMANYSIEDATPSDHAAILGLHEQLIDDWHQRIYMNQA